MNQAKQIELLKELIAHLDGRTTADAGHVVRIPTSSYTCPDLAKREWGAFFQNHPQIIGLSGDLPTPNSFVTLDDFGIPVLATRDADGRFRAFVNACRHRGAQLTDAPSGESRKFSCPFHGWSYANDGRLLGIRKPGQFGAIDKSCNGLVELPAEEYEGLLVVHPQVDGELDTRALLGDVAEELAALEFFRADRLGESTLDKPINWKIANDTFNEIYHFSILHSKTVGNILHGDVATYREFGRHHRLCAAQKHLDVVRQKPESEWNLSDAAITLYYLFPNVQLAFFNRVLALVRIYPDPTDPRRSITKVTHYGAVYLGDETTDDAAETLAGKEVYAADPTQRLEFNLSTQIEIFVSTTDEEDYEMGLKTQASAESGKLEHFLFGRNEPALHHLHNTYRDALGMPPLERVEEG